MGCRCNQSLIKLRQGDDSDFNGETIRFFLDSLADFTNWSAKFQLQNKCYDLIIYNNTVELVVPGEDSLEMEPGFWYGYLQLIDTNGKKQTVHAQRFLIEPRRVFGE